MPQLTSPPAGEPDTITQPFAGAVLPCAALVVDPPVPAHRLTETLPAEIWRLNETKVTKVFAKDKEVASVVIDPEQRTTDVNTSDNAFPRVQAPNKFDEMKKKQGTN